MRVAVGRASGEGPAREDTAHDNDDNDDYNDIHGGLRSTRRYHNTTRR